MTTAARTTTIAFAREPLADCREDLRPLLEDHWREIAHYQDIPLRPDWEAYTRIERDGGLRIFTLRDYGVLRGYAVFFVRWNLHYMTSLQAAQDVLYLDPILRGQALGAQFIAWCDEELRKEHVQVVYHHVKLSHDWGALLARLGYERVETIWSRRLDQG